MMMKWQPFDGKQIEREVNEELAFHLEMLTKEHHRQNMSWKEAGAAALERFGSVEQISAQCVEISRRNHPLIRALKSFLILVFLFGVLVRVFSPELHLTRVGDILIAVGILGRLLLYVHGLTPASIVSKNETLSPLKLNDTGQGSFRIYEQRRRTPFERVISK